MDFGTVVRNEGDPGLFGWSFDFILNHHVSTVKNYIKQVNKIIPTNIPITLNNLPINIPTEGNLQ
jgi:hypothetical protein